MIINPEDLRGAVLPARACRADGESWSWVWSGVGEGVEGFTVCVCLSISNSDISGLELETGYSEYSRFLGGTALEIFAVSTVMLISLSAR